MNKLNRHAQFLQDLGKSRKTLRSRRRDMTFALWKCRNLPMVAVVMEGLFLLMHGRWVHHYSMPSLAWLMCAVSPVLSCWAGGGMEIRYRESASVSRHYSQISGNLQTLCNWSIWSLARLLMVIIDCCVIAWKTSSALMNRRVTSTCQGASWLPRSCFLHLCGSTDGNSQMVSGLKIGCGLPVWTLLRVPPSLPALVFLSLYNHVSLAKWCIGIIHQHAWLLFDSSIL